MSVPAVIQGPEKSNALFRPSSAGRWLACPGSVLLSQGLDGSGSSAAAREGTAVHLMGEKALLNEREPIEWLDRYIPVEGHQIHVDDGMVEGAQMYVDYVRSQQAAGATLEIEARLTLQPLDPTDALLGECRGSSDAVLFWEYEGILEVDDLKFGRGYMVPAAAKQPRLYGLMALLRYQSRVPWREIRTTIVQPRDPNESQRVRTHTYDPQEIMDFAGEVYGAMLAATQPNAPLVPGTEQCQWCPAKGICPALAQGALDVARSAFTAAPLHAGSPVPAPGPSPSLPDLDQATDEDIAVWLERRTLVEEWFKGVEQRAAQRITAGRAIRGWKMVQRTGNRKFVDPDAVPAKLRELGVQTAKMYAPPKLLSPAQIEALLPGRNKDERAALLAPLVDRADNGLALVRDDNKKPAAAGVFGPVA